MPLQATSGAASYDGFGGGVAAVPNYIEDVFSTYLYTGNGSTQTITNGIDLAGKGGLVWTKQRNGGAVAQDNGHALIDTVRGRGSLIQSNTTAAALAPPAGYQISSFGSSGYTLGADYYVLMNDNASTFSSWTFRKQPKFFDVVTYTGNDVAGRTVAHNLGSVPGVIIVKSTSAAGDWAVYHRSLGATQYTLLNSTAAAVTDSSYWQNTTPTSTEFTLGGAGRVNYGGRSYVAYLFAHDAGGFGLTGTDNVISCGSFTGQATVNLGWEPQLILYKVTNVTGDWKMVDNMRGLVVDNGSGTGDKVLKPNLSSAEAGDYVIDPTSTGFKGYESAGNTYIYIAIRRGPMKVPTSGTSVFALGTSTSDSSGYTLTSNFPVDSYLYGRRTGGSNHGWMERLTNGRLFTNTTDAEGSTSGYVFWDSNVNVRRTGLLGGASTVDYAFRRAPSFFDEVCYTGTGSATAVSHNLQAVPQLIITKSRSAVEGWPTVALSSGTSYYSLSLNTTGTGGSPTNLSAYISSTSITPYAFSNATSGVTYVAYLFATCPGVSKVGSYTGNSSTQTIDCGFAGGARFVLIKRTNNTGSWFVFDTARGMTTVTDPYLLLNSTGAESNTLGAVTTVSTGFALNDAILTGINTTGGTYIYLAIA